MFWSSSINVYFPCWHRLDCLAKFAELEAFVMLQSLPLCTFYGWMPFLGPMTLLTHQICLALSLMDLYFVYLRHFDHVISCTAVSLNCQIFCRHDIASSLPHAISVFHNLPQKHLFALCLLQRNGTHTFIFANTLLSITSWFSLVLKSWTPYATDLRVAEHVPISSILPFPQSKYTCCLAAILPTW